MHPTRPLPPLLSLRAFEAAARRLSFSHAAQELFVTQSAISHQIQKLEADLGVALFERRTRAIELMPERLSLVCIPALVDGKSRPRKPQDLLRFPLLASYSKHAFEWEVWAHRFGLDLSRAQRVQLHDYNIVVEAALAGQGIAMGRHRLIAQQLASKALVEVLPDAVLDDPRIGWWLVTPKGTLGGPASAFRT
ncbi:LysR family transcriptional regulator [Paraburkholderia sediminicola]|uniref:LysR family transcriptional regulator n=1 Tax=Paraburkholderia sediminicola TaxID=458836 RepID=UPI0038BD1174